MRLATGILSLALPAAALAAALVLHAQGPTPACTANAGVVNYLTGAGAVQGERYARGHLAGLTWQTAAERRNYAEVMKALREPEHPVMTEAGAHQWEQVQVGTGNLAQECAGP